MDDNYVFTLRTPVRLAEYFPQTDIRQRLPAQAQDADGLVGNLVRRKLDAFADHFEGNDISLVVGDHGKAVDDGQSKRQANGDGRALAFRALNFDIAAQKFDIAPHHIHADAAPREIRDRVRRGETCFENEIEEFLVGDLFPFGQQIEGASLGQNALTVEACAVVRELDQDVSRLVECGESERATWRFSDGVTYPGRFDSMIYGIPDHVKQWIFEVLEDS